MPYKCIVYDKTKICLEGFKAYFSNIQNFELIALFSDFNEFTDYLDNYQQPDFIILNDDIPRKSFPDAIRFLKEKYPETKIIAISANTSEYDIFAAIKSGASSYLYKPNLKPGELQNALESALHDEDYFNEPVSNIIIQSYVKKAKKGDEISHRNPKNLTRREVQILQLICEGLTNKQIADGLFISVRTVDAHKNHIMQKLGLKSTAELVKFAIKNGYVKL